MNTQLFDELLNLSLKGKITFPEVVMKLAENGVERYLMDLVAMQKITYDSKGHFHQSSFFSEDGPHIPTTFDGSKVREAIKNIQMKNIDFKTFLHHIMEAGCCHYEVFILGKQVIYFGRDGSHHIEMFPK